jgi:hypothetical protein
MTPAQQTHVATCRPCHELVARVAEEVRWLKAVEEYPRAVPEEVCAPGVVEEAAPAGEVKPYDLWQASRKALDEVQPFGLRLDRAMGRLSRVDRRRVKGPHGQVEGGVRLPLTASHAADLIVAGTPLGLEVQLAEIARDRPVRFLRGAQVGLRTGKRWQTASTDPTGRVRLEIPRRGRYVLEVVYTLLDKPLRARIEIEVV